MAVTVKDAIASLPRLRWRGIAFPFDSLSTDTTHRQATHRMPDRDGAKLEDMGLAERRISGRAMFFNGVVFEPTTYTVPLFPNVYLQFIAACEDRTTGDLVHPTRGTLRCKVSQFRDSIAAGQRDGAAIDVTWVEDTEDTDDSVATAKAEPLSEAISAANRLDTNVAAIKNSGFKRPSFSFEDAMRSIRSVSDTATLISKKGAGLISRAQYHLDSLRNSVDSLNDATLNTVRRDIERMQSALHQVKRSQAITREVSFYIVPAEATLGGLAARLKQKMTDLLTLNTNLAGVSIVPARTVVRYYSA